MRGTNGKCWANGERLSPDVGLLATSARRTSDHHLDKLPRIGREVYAGNLDGKKSRLGKEWRLAATRGPERLCGGGWQPSLGDDYAINPVK